MNAIKRLLIRLALGKRTYAYMMRTLSHDTRVRNAHDVDFVVRKDGLERRIEADWIKKIARIVLPGPWPPGLKHLAKH